MSTQSAVDQVFDTTELLELILAAPNLDMQTLLVSCSRVSRRWKGVIDQGPQIQKKLFLLPDEECMPNPNPLLWKHFPFAFQTIRTDAMGRLTGKSLFYDMHKGALDTRFHENSTVIFQKMDDKREAFGHDSASWRRMLVHQPTYPGVGYVCTGITSKGIEAFSRTVVPEPGPPLRMQRLLAEVLSSVPPRASKRLSSVGRSFRVLWHYERTYFHPFSAAYHSASVQKAFDEQMRTHGILVHQDMDPSYGEETTLNDNMALLHDILKEDVNSSMKRAHSETPNKRESSKRCRR